MVVSRSHRPAIVTPVIESLGITRVTPCGSVGVKIARIVRGQADLYVHGCRGAKHWDAAAPEAILCAAGGRFTDLDGAAIDYRNPSLALSRGIVASNGAVHDRVLSITRGCQGT
jgi:3'(2'), 5'-bisphosphate nucleotidase